MTREEVLQMAKVTDNVNTIQTIINFSNDELRLALFNNPNLTKEDRKFIIDKTDFTNYDISNMLPELAESKLDTNKILVAKHNLCTSELLIKLYNNTENEELLLAICQNKNCTTDLLINISNNFYSLKQSVFDILKTRDLTEERLMNCMLKDNEIDYEFVLSHKDCTMAILEYISAKKPSNESLCDLVLSHKNISLQTLLNYITNTYWDRNPRNAWKKLCKLYPEKVTSKLIDEILSHDDIRIKNLILSHKNCSTDTLVNNFPKYISKEDFDIIQNLKSRDLTTDQISTLLRRINSIKNIDFVFDLDACTPELFEFAIKKVKDDSSDVQKIISHKNFPTEIIPKVINLNQDICKVFIKQFKDKIDIYAYVNSNYLDKNKKQNIIENTNSVITLINLVNNDYSEPALDKLSTMSMSEKDFQLLTSNFYDLQYRHNRENLIYKILEMIINHKSCTFEILCNIIKQVRSYFNEETFHQVTHRFNQLSIDQIKQLYELNCYKLNEYIYTLPNCPTSILMDSALKCENVTTASKLISAFKSRELSEEDLVKLSTCKHWSFRAFVAGHALCSIEMLNTLSEDKDQTVITTVASNPNCPINTMLKIAARVKDVLANERITSEMLSNLYALGDKAYYPYIIKNPNCPEDVRKQIENSNVQIKTILYIKTQSGFSADGFDLIVYDKNDNSDPIKRTEFNYRYGYDASYDKSWATEEKPFTTDILLDVVKQYDIDKIMVGAGTFVFSGKPMTQDDCNRFINSYIYPNNLLTKLYEA